MTTKLGVQCLSCGFTREPVSGAYKCEKCGDVSNLHIYPLETTTSWDEFRSRLTLKLFDPSSTSRAESVLYGLLFGLLLVIAVFAALLLAELVAPTPGSSSWP